MKQKRPEYSLADSNMIALEQRLDRIIAEELPGTKSEESRKLQKSLKKHRDKIFTYLYNSEVPPDNNGSERAIRNVKVKQKVSGQFK